MNRQAAARHVLGSAGLYPITTVYLTGVLLILGTVWGRIEVLSAVLLFAVVALIAVAWTAFRELRAVHRLLDGQRTELVDRIDELTELVIDLGGTVPPRSPREQTTRNAIRDEELRR